MATMGDKLVAGKARAGQGGTGKHHKGRAAGLVATVALGLGLVVGGLLSQGRQAIPAAQPNVAPLASGLDWEQQERGQVAPGPQANVTATHGTIATLDWEQQERTVVAPGSFSPDQFTYREDQRAISPGGSGCVAASAAGVPGEGCGTVPVSLPDTGFSPDQFTYREDRRVEP